MGLIKGSLTLILVFVFMMAGANKVSDQVMTQCKEEEEPGELGGPASCSASWNANGAMRVGASAVVGAGPLGQSMDNEDSVE